MALLDAVASEATGPATLHIPMACLAAMAEGMSASPCAEASVRIMTACGVGHDICLVSAGCGLASRDDDCMCWGHRKTLLCTGLAYANQVQMAALCTKLFAYYARRLVPRRIGTSHRACCVLCVLRRLR